MLPGIHLEPLNCEGMSSGFVSPSQPLCKALGLRVKEIHVSAMRGLVSWQDADYGPHIQTHGEHRFVGRGCCQHTAAPKHGHLDVLDVLGQPLCHLQESASSLKGYWQPPQHALLGRTMNIDLCPFQMCQVNSSRSAVQRGSLAGSNSCWASWPCVSLLSK